MGNSHSITTTITSDGRKYTFKECLENRLGKGGFGAVFKGRGPKIHSADGIVAIKVIDKDHADVYAFRELQMSQKLREFEHPNIMPVFACQETASSIYIVMKCFDDGDLWEYIAKKRNLDEKETCRIFSGICSGLNILHARNIIHRDLKPQNILLELTERGMSPVLTDFGLARELNPDSVGRSAVGTLPYLPPECVENAKNVRYTKPSDMWSMGAIFYTNAGPDVSLLGIWRGGLKVIGDTSPKGILFDILRCLDFTSLVTLQLTDQRLRGAVASNTENLPRR